jgi:TIR domain
MSRYFIIHAAADREWAKWIGGQLEALGNSSHIYERPREDKTSYSWISRRLEAQDKIICVLSSAYLKFAGAPIGLNEDQPLRACRRHPNLASVILVEPCNVPSGCEVFAQCEIFGIPEIWARQRLREFISRSDFDFYPSGPRTEDGVYSSQGASTA